MTRQRRPTAGADRCGPAGHAGRSLDRHRADQAHRLGSGGGVAQAAADGGGDRAGAGLADAAHRHAQVLALDDDDDARAAADAARGRRRSGVVRRSWTCGRRAKRSTRRASLDRPVMRPSLAGCSRRGRPRGTGPGGARRCSRPRCRDQDHLVVVDRRTWSAAPRQASWSRPGERLRVGPGDPVGGVAQPSRSGSSPTAISSSSADRPARRIRGLVDGRPAAVRSAIAWSGLLVGSAGAAARPVDLGSSPSADCAVPSARGR